LRKLLHLLGGSPIAIRQARAFIREAKTDVSTYLQLYQTTAKKLHESNTDDQSSLRISPEDPAVTVTANIIYNHLCNGEETAVGFLKLWTYLDHCDLWYELFTPDFPLPVQPESLWWFRRAVRETEVFDKTMQKLCAYGMSQAKEGVSGYFLHPVLHECVRQIASTEVDSELAWLAVRTVGRAMPDGSTEDEQHLKHRLSFHADRCHHHIIEDTAESYFTLQNPFLPKGVKLDTALIYTSAVERLGKLFVQKRITSKANDLLLRAVNGYTKILGAENEVTLRTISSRAEILTATGKLEEAETSFLQVANGAERTLGTSDPMTWTAFQNLSAVQQKQGKFELTESTLRRVLGFIEKEGGHDHPRAVRTVEALSSVTLLRGNYSEAVNLSLRALSARRASKGPEYMNLVESMLLLAVSCIYGNKSTEAEKAVLACLQAYTEILDPKVHVVLGLVVEVATLYQKQGRLEQAIDMFLQAVEGYEQAPGDHKKEMADAAYNLATVYLFQNELANAEKMVVKSIEGYNSALGEDHHYTLDALANLGTIQNQLGQLSEAEKTNLQVLARKERALGPNHRKTLETVSNLGAFYAVQDKFAEAEKMYFRALDGFKTTLGPKHSLTLSVYVNMGSLYDSMDRRYDAGKSYLLALDGYQEVMLRQSPTGMLQESATAHGPTAGYKHDVKGHSVIFTEASGAAEEPLSAFIPGFTATLGQLDKLGVIHMKNMEWEDGEDMHLRVLNSKELFLGSNHKSTLEAGYALARSLFFHCLLEATGEEEIMKPSQLNIGGWAETNPLWRLAHLAETYTTSAGVLRMLGKTLLALGDEENGKTVLTFEAVLATKNTGASSRECDRCKTLLTLNTGWYLCKSCIEDKDLCETCFDSREQWEHPCRAHGFAVVISTDSDINELLLEYSDPIPWLSSLKEYVLDIVQEV
jgi:tetratricopeptide (TPR) repeat protein